MVGKIVGINRAIPRLYYMSNSASLQDSRLQSAPDCTLLWIDFQTHQANLRLGSSLSGYFSIQSHRNPPDVARLIAEVRPAVICFEFDSPDVSGLRVLRETKLNNPSLPILMLSDPPSAELALWALRTRVWDYFVRPVTSGEIARRINILAKVTHAQRHRGAREVFLPQHVLPTGPMMSYENAPDETTVIDVAIEYLHEYFNTKFSLLDVARICGMGQYEFSRQFKRVCGITFRDYVIGYRISEASIMLRDTALDILEVALATGFNDASHFSRTFRRHYGLTPSAYRLDNMPSCEDPLRTTQSGYVCTESTTSFAL